MKNDWIPLRPGEPIGVVALSGPVDSAKLDAGLQVLRGWGNPVIEASNLRREETYLAGGDEDLARGLIDDVLRDDPQLKNLTKLALLVLGLAPALRNTLRLVLGV